MPPAVCLVGGVLGCWHRSRYGGALGGVLGPPKHYWTEVTPLDIATMAGIAALSYWVAIIAISRNRRGADPLSVGIIARLSRLFDWAPDVDTRFRNPAQAQLWAEWRKKGWAMPAATAFGLLMWLSCWLLFSRQSEDLWPALAAGGALLTILGLLGGLVMGNVGVSEAKPEIAQFLATRPITTVNLARIILRATAKSVTAAWLVWAAAFLTVYLLLRATQATPPVELEIRLRWWFLPASLIGCWIVAGVVTTIILTGRPRTFMELMFGGLAVFFALNLFSVYALSPEARTQMLRGVVVAIGAGGVLAAACAIMVARRRGLIDWPTVYAALGIWLALSSVVAMERLMHPADPLLLYVFAVGMAALAVFPLAAAPLALSWNRNR
jgi:hypothetical protein